MTAHNCLIIPLSELHPRAFFNFIPSCSMILTLIIRNIALNGCCPMQEKCGYIPFHSNSILDLRHVGAPPIANPLVTRTIDVVRWGGFKATHGEFNGSPIVDIGSGFYELIFHLGLSDSLQSYPQNIPMGYIPEWSSMARHFNKVSVVPGTESTNSSFYFTTSPLPGWPSLK